MPLSFTTFREKEREQMPREKMHQYGASALQMWELIAILMRTGERRGGSSEDVEQLSKRLLSEGGLRGLFTEVNPSKIMANFGTYKSHAETIAATAEICNRLSNRHNSFDVAEPSKVAKHFKYLQKAINALFFLKTSNGFYHNLCRTKQYVHLKTL